MDPVEEDLGDLKEDQGDIQEDQGDEAPQEPPPEEPPQEPPQEPPKEPPKKKVPKKYEKAACQKCDKVMSVNTLRYKHKCGDEEVPKAPPPKPKARSRAPPPEPKLERQVTEEPESPKTHLRNLYAEVRMQQLEAKRNRFRGFFD